VKSTSTRGRIPRTCPYVAKEPENALLSLDEDLTKAASAPRAALLIV
jgi:hypothetical protein